MSYSAHCMRDKNMEGRNIQNANKNDEAFVRSGCRNGSNRERRSTLWMRL